MLLEELPLLDELTSAETTHYETGNWTKMPWCTLSLRAAGTGAHPESFSTATGSYWSASSFTRGACTMKYVSGGLVSERYLALWVCLEAASHNGYRCQFFDTATSEQWVAKIFKVTGGVESLLAESAAVTGLFGKHLGFWNNNGTLEAWYQPEAGAWTLLTSHADSTYTTGDLGIDGSGSNPSLTGFHGASSTTGKVLNMVV